MGIFDKLFGTKKDKEEVKAKEAKIEESIKAEESIEESIEENKVEESKKDDVKVVDEKELLLNVLKSKIQNMNLEVSEDKEAILIPEFDVTIKAAIRNKDQQGNNYLVEIEFFVYNKEFGEEGIYESFAGIGKDSFEEAVSSCVDIFIKTLLNVVIDALKDNHSSILDIETNKRSIARTWHSYIGALQSQGFASASGLGNNLYFNLLKDQIAKRLNNLRYYWIKILVTRQANGAARYQCLLNNKPFLEAERILDEYVQGLPADNSIMLEMQYIIIRQSDESYNENIQKDIEHENFMKECAEYAIGVFENYGPEDSIEGLINKIAEYAKDFNAAWEFLWFIPAIYCRAVLQGVMYTDTVIQILPEGKRVINKLYDYETYLIAVDVVLKKLQENQDPQKIEKILLLSDEYKALQKMVKEGSDPKDLRPVPMVFVTPSTYTVLD